MEECTLVNTEPHRTRSKQLPVYHKNNAELPIVIFTLSSLKITCIVLYVYGSLTILTTKEMHPGKIYSCFQNQALKCKIIGVVTK